METVEIDANMQGFCGNEIRINGHTNRKRIVKAAAADAWVWPLIRISLPQNPCMFASISTVSTR
ncbi:hypothetical protein AB4Z22_38225 [Paenibacillus sp. TAF58]